MKFSEKYKGAFFKASDVQEKPMRLTIEEIAEQEVGDEPKVVVRFKAADQALVLNKTNASILAEKWGDDMEDWHGQTVLLKADKTPFNGKLVPCIRVEPVEQETAPAGAEAENDDDINV
jgi:hypothetical protein